MEWEQNKKACTDEFKEFIGIFMSTNIMNKNAKIKTGRNGKFG